MLKNERTLTTTYTGGATAGIAILRTDGSLLVHLDRGTHLVVHGLAEAVLEENAAYLAWREEQGGTPGKAPGDCPEGGEHVFSSDLEYDNTGETINCEKCGESEG